MAIRFISGKPGAGKSYYATVLVLERLRNTRKQIVTNLPLNVANICEHLHQEHGETFDAAERIRLLDETQAASFWIYFGNGLELDPKDRVTFKQPDGRLVTHLNYQARYDFANAHPKDNSGSVCYFIDEAHEFFNAREWKDMGKDCLHYLSQHRKLGDDVTFITQHVRNVDTQLRRLCFEFCYARNHLKEKLPALGGLFRSIPRFGVAFYNQEEGPTALQIDHKYIKPEWSTIGKCYDTAAGVGIGGCKADIGERAKGLPVSFVFVALALIGLGFHFLTDANFWMKITGQDKPAAVHAAVRPKAQAQHGPLSQMVFPVSAIETSKATNQVQDLGRERLVQDDRPEVRVTGIAFDRREIVIYLSDGRKVLGHQKAFGGVKRDYAGRIETVIIEGHEYTAP